MIVVRGGTGKPVSSQKLADYFEARADIEGYLYLGYPIIGTIEGGYPIDALFLSDKHGAIIFHLVEGIYDNTINVSDIQDENYTKLESKLKQHNDLNKKKGLAVQLNVATFASAWIGRSDIKSEYPVLVTEDDLTDFLNATKWDDNQTYQKLISVIQSITTIKNRNKRGYVKKTDSKGAKLKKLEESIANLDRQQSTAVIETVEGVQRIRGLAGSGKTIVLALKVAYLHAKNPDWHIAVTFNSRSLKNQLKHFITLFTLEHTNEEPDWDKIDIIHAWGSPSIRGIYYEICLKHNVEYYDFKTAESMAKVYGKGFDVACEKAYNEIESFQQSYDVVLVDEAQDFSPYFLRLCYRILKQPKRLVYAYDELQNISNKQMPSPEELFGLDNNGKPLVSLHNIQGKPKQDIVLDVCYRNSRPLLATAHALGFGIYRKKGLIQMFEQHQLWKDVGYKIKDGKLADGEPVTLIRNCDSSPEFLENHSTIDDLITFKSFNNDAEQIAYLIAEIEKNKNEDELKLDDIMVIHPEPYTAKRAVGVIREQLFKKGINSNLAGVTTTPDEFFKNDAVVFTHIYRAKGNEASMVYIINAHECFSDYNISQKRNMLFTALTRSKAWVRVIGYGENMKALQQEFEEVKKNNFELKFTYPTAAEREKLNIVNRDMTEQERKNLDQKSASANDLLQSLKIGELHKEDLSEELREQLKALL
ncbi:MAG: ATP-binding domain-containing protein [Methylococcaceae bacterium]